MLTIFMTIGASFGAMNTMYGRVGGPTREIAARRALPEALRDA